MKIYKVHMQKYAFSNGELTEFNSLADAYSFRLKLANELLDKNYTEAYLFTEEPMLFTNSIGKCVCRSRYNHPIPPTDNDPVFLHIYEVEDNK